MSVCVSVFECVCVGCRVGGGSAGWVLDRHGEIGDGGVRGELKQKDGLHLSDWPTLKWPSLRID